MRRSFLFSIVLSVLFHCQCMQAEEPPTRPRIEEIKLQKKVDQLLLLIQKRLAIMHEVAKTKWNHHIAIEDKEREQQILAALAAKADQYQLDPKFVVHFFEAQIEASKKMQRTDFSAFEEAHFSPFESVLSLKDDLRIYIDEINQELFVLLSEIMPQKPYFDRYLFLSMPISNRILDAVDLEVWQQAIAPLRE